MDKRTLDSISNRIPSSSHLISLSSVFNHPNVQGEKNISTVGIGKASATIDTIAEEALAWRWDWCRNEKMKIHYEDSRKSVARLVVKEVSRNENIVSTIKRLPFPFSSREFVIYSFWTRNPDGSLSYYFESLPDNIHVDYGFSNSYVRSYSIGRMTFTNIGDRQSLFTLVQRTDSRGNIPVWLMNMKIKDSLSTAGELVTTFGRDDEVDMKERDALVDIIRNEDQVYSEDEIAAIRKVSELLDSSSIPVDSWMPITSSDPYVKMESTFKEGQVNIIGRSITVLDPISKLLLRFTF